MSEFVGVAPAIKETLISLREFTSERHPLFKYMPFTPTIPHRGEARMHVTIPDDFDDQGLIFGGVYTILLDTLMATSAWSTMDEFDTMVTINLKTDFFRDAPSGTTLDCIAHCEGVSEDVAVCHGEARDKDGVLAHAAATFLIGNAKSGKGSRL